MYSVIHPQKFEVKNVVCAYSNRILFSPITFNLFSGNLLYIKGNNGVGKTTLLRTFSGLSKPLFGQILWCAENIFTSQCYPKHLFYLGHKNYVKSSLSLYENLKWSATNDQKPTRHQVETAIEKVGLEPYLHQFAAALSSGQRQRLALANLFLRRQSSLWILDEPFSSLDASGIELVLTALHEHLGAGGMAILTSHQLIDKNDIKYIELELSPYVKYPEEMA